LQFLVGFQSDGSKSVKLAVSVVAEGDRSKERDRLGLFYISPKFLNPNLTKFLTYLLNYLQAEREKVAGITKTTDFNEPQLLKSCFI